MIFDIFVKETLNKIINVESIWKSGKDLAASNV